MELYGGIDLHSNNNVIAILDEEDRVVFQKRLNNDIGLVLKVLEPYRDKLVGPADTNSFESRAANPELQPNRAPPNSGFIKSATTKPAAVQTGEPPGIVVCSKIFSAARHTRFLYEIRSFA